MKRTLKSLAIITLGMNSLVAMASPTYLVTHNRTNLESNAFVAGTTPSPTPTRANSNGTVHWAIVRMACYGHIINGKCPALIKMATNTTSPINLGHVVIDIETGDITPKIVSGNGFTLTVNGPAEATLTKN